jgi:sulfur carrier protein ThiS
MKIRIRLFGTLGNKFSEHDPMHGFEVEIPDDATVGDLMKKLDILESKIGIVSIDGRLVTTTKKLEKGNLVRMYHPLSGG